MEVHLALDQEIGLYAQRLSKEEVTTWFLSSEAVQSIEATTAATMKLNDFISSQGANDLIDSH